MSDYAIFKDILIWSIECVGIGIIFRYLFKK